MATVTAHPHSLSARRAAAELSHSGQEASWEWKGEPRARQSDQAGAPRKLGHRGRIAAQTSVAEPASPAAAMIHGFSFFFFFALSFLGIVPFKNSQPHLS